MLSLHSRYQFKYYVMFTANQVTSLSCSVVITLQCSALTILRNVRSTTSKVQELVQVHHLKILTFKDLLNQ